MSDNNNKATSVNSVNAEQAGELLSLLESMHAIVATHYDSKTEKTQVLGPFLTGGENATRQWLTVVERATSRLDHFQKSQLHSAREALKGRIDDHCAVALIDYEDSIAPALALPEKTRKALGITVKDHILVPLADLVSYFPNGDKGEATVEEAARIMIKVLGYQGRVLQTAEKVAVLRVPFVATVKATVNPQVEMGTDGAGI